MDIVMATLVAKMSVEEFLAQPGDTYHDFHELHDGEVVEGPSPSVKHFKAQRRLENLLNVSCGAGYVAAREY